MPPLTVLALTLALPLPSVPFKFLPKGNSFFTTNAGNSLLKLPFIVLAVTFASALEGKLASI